MKIRKSIRSHHFALSARPFEILFFRLTISAASRIPKRSVKQSSRCGNVAQISQKSSCPILDYDFAFEENKWYNWKIAFPNIVPRLFSQGKTKASSSGVDTWATPLSRAAGGLTSLASRQIHQTLIFSTFFLSFCLFVCFKTIILVVIFSLKAHIMTAFQFYYVSIIIYLKLWGLPWPPTQNFKFPSVVIKTGYNVLCSCRNININHI